MPKNLRKSRVLLQQGVGSHDETNKGKRAQTGRPARSTHGPYAGRAGVSGQRDLLFAPLSFDASLLTHLWNWRNSICGAAQLPGGAGKPGLPTGCKEYGALFNGGSAADYGAGAACGIAASSEAFGGLLAAPGAASAHGASDCKYCDAGADPVCRPGRFEWSAGAVGRIAPTMVEWTGKLLGADWAVSLEKLRLQCGAVSGGSEHDPGGAVSNGSAGWCGSLGKIPIHYAAAADPQSVFRFYLQHCEQL